METSFLPLLFGGDINVYSMARAFHEAYGIRSTAYGKFATGVCYESAILDYRVCAKNEDGPTFLENVRSFAAEQAEDAAIHAKCESIQRDLARKTPAQAAQFDVVFHKKRSLPVGKEHTARF